MSHADTFPKSAAGVPPEAIGLCWLSSCAAQQAEGHTLLAAVTSLNAVDGLIKVMGPRGGNATRPGSSIGEMGVGEVSIGRRQAAVLDAVLQQWPSASDAAWIMPAAKRLLGHQDVAGGRAVEGLDHGE